MDIETCRLYCLSKLGAEECFPFDEHTLVFKVMGKMFALCGLERNPMQINLKANPEYSEELRDTYTEHIFPGFHMSKKHWNSVFLEEGLEDALITSLIDHSYDLVVAKLPKKNKVALQELANE